MLKDGYHEAFGEMFSLIQEGKRLEGENDSVQPNQIGIYDISRKEDILCVFSETLILAELALRRGNADDVYAAQKKLAEFFQTNGITWLSEYFYLKSLESSKRILNDGRRTEAETLQLVGKINFKKDDFELAEYHLVEFYEISKGSHWYDTEGINLHCKSCETLQELYTARANEGTLQNSDDQTICIAFLEKAHQMAIESENQKLIAMSCFNLGNGFMNIDDVNKAGEYFQMYLKICEEQKDKIGIGKAYQSLALCYQRLDQVPSAIEVLERFVKIASEDGSLNLKIDAFRDICKMHSISGLYDNAYKFSEMAFDTAKELKCDNSVEMTRVEYGIALSNSIITGLATNLITNNRDNTDSIIQWKTERLKLFAAKNDS